jgi:hypothetical protein
MFSPFFLHRAPRFFALYLNTPPCMEDSFIAVEGAFHWSHTDLPPFTRLPCFMLDPACSCLHHPPLPTTLVSRTLPMPPLDYFYISFNTIHVLTLYKLDNSLGPNSRTWLLWNYCREVLYSKKARLVCSKVDNGPTLLVHTLWIFSHTISSSHTVKAHAQGWRSMIYNKKLEWALEVKLY